MRLDEDFTPAPLGLQVVRGADRPRHRARADGRGGAEGLRWVMGETSHKSMRAAAMDDVIFSGTNLRPARNFAEVTMFLDNQERQAPAEFNDHDVIEITRRIEREAGSAYRINGRDSRA